MPGPLPGMDPYLEHPAGWPGLHNRLITALADHLAPAVAPHFFVNIEERVYVTSLTGDEGRERLVPDVFVVRSPHPAATPPLGAAELTITPATEIEELLDEEVHDLYLEIVDAELRQVVTAIEVLSPANKVRGARGYETMRAKQKTLSQGGANILEIDLLRAGERPPSLVGQGDYVVSLRKPGSTTLFAWFWNIRDPMPTVGVPLKLPFADVPLPLQSLFNAVYDRAFYALSINYTQPVPYPPLRLADAAWVERTLQAWREGQADQA